MLLRCPGHTEQILDEVFDVLGEKFRWLWSAVKGKFMNP